MPSAVPVSKKATVIGQGLIGLPSALKLLEQGNEVVIISSEEFSKTNSLTAGAYWWPHKAYPEDRVKKWSKETFDVFKKNIYGRAPVEKPSDLAFKIIL